MKYINPNDLGTMTDAEIAKKYGVTIRTVQYRRKKFGVPSYRLSRIDWAEIDPVIFKWSCVKIAEAFGVHRRSIEYRREKLKKEEKCGKQQ